MKFFISDTHFYHKNVILYSNRPYSSVEEMNSSLIKNWNDLVKKGDEVYHLGDFAFCKYPEIKHILSCLNGNKHLILGNHDKLIENNKNDLLKLGLFRSIQNYKEIYIQKTKTILFHYGCRVWRSSHYGSIMLYGHSHGSLPPHGKSVDVGVDCKEITSEYRPISEEEIITYMNNKIIKVVDHHRENNENS